MAELKVNSMRVRFENGSAEPTDADIFAFMREKMKLRSDDLLSMYKEKSTMSVIIKFKTEEDMLKALRRLPGTMDFVIDKYRSCKVTLSAANSVVRYVRLFNLPPEVEDKEIWAVMAKYGNIQRMVRETYGAETGYPIWTSVRGLYMELKEGEEIPANINVRNMRARVYYEGLLNKCYQCGSTEHIKVDCPQKRSVNERMNTETSSYSGALKGVWNKQKKVTDQGRTETGTDGTMTNLNALVASGASSSASVGERNKGVAPAARNNGESHKTESDNGTNTTISTAEQTNTRVMEADGRSYTAEAVGGAADGAAAVATGVVDAGAVDDELDGDAVVGGDAVNEAESDGAHVVGVSNTCVDLSTPMDADGFSLKRGRDYEQTKGNTDTDDSSTSDTPNVEKEKNRNSSTISGWQKVTTRARNKQPKLTQSQQKP